MKVAKFLLFLTASLVGSGQKSAYARMVTNMTDALEYMERYGYINRTTMEKMEEMSEKSMSSMMKESVKMFQKFSGMNGTGELDGKTMEMMNAPRCGNKENMEMMRNDKMTPGYMLHRPWEFADLTYRIENFPPTGLSPEVVRREIRRAFDLWQAVANFTCREVIDTEGTTEKEADEVDIDISFVTGPHNDNEPFSKRLAGQPVAHAFYPHPGQIYHHVRGDIHFDATRGWTINTVDGINFFQTATHEIGHSLGLEHSAAAHSVMHAIPQVKYDPSFALHSDDIKGIQNLYGARVHSKNSFARARTSVGSQPRSRVRELGTPSSAETNYHPLPGIADGSPRLEPPSIVVMYYFQPLKYLWHCHQLATIHHQLSLNCYEQVSHYLISRNNNFMHESFKVPGRETNIRRPR